MRFFPRRVNTLLYTILVEATCGCIALTSLLTDFRKGDLTYREWTPYNYSSRVLFCTIYARQLISTTYGSMVNVACDSLVCGLLLHVCCQLEILKCRLGKVSLGRSDLRECVRQHERIFKLVPLNNLASANRQKERNVKRKKEGKRKMRSAAE